MNMTAVSMTAECRPSRVALAVQRLHRPLSLSHYKKSGVHLYSPSNAAVHFELQKKWSVVTIDKSCLMNLARALSIVKGLQLAHNTLHSKLLQFCTGKGMRITITPLVAGHTVGGSVWKIRIDSDEIVYAVDYNHRKERYSF
jgi:hypothetical protein